MEYREPKLPVVSEYVFIKFRHTASVELWSRFRHCIDSRGVCAIWQRACALSDDRLNRFSKPVSHAELADSMNFNHFRVPQLPFSHSSHRSSNPGPPEFWHMASLEFAASTLFALRPLSVDLIVAKIKPWRPCSAAPLPSSQIPFSHSSLTI